MPRALDVALQGFQLGVGKDQPFTAEPVKIYLNPSVMSLAFVI